MEIPGLVVQVLNPPTHFLPAVAPEETEVRANVTMMSGCPIGKSPRGPADFDVMAVARRGEYDAVELPLVFDENAPYGAPSRFTAAWAVPKNATGQPLSYEIIVSAFQPKTGNTGADKATVVIPAPQS